MPELKRNFLKGKMNKDLDERLVPDGEYRDALNIEISTSEDSDVGSVQNVKGNKYIENTSYTLSNSAESVGHYVDEINSHAYNFVRLASDVTANTSFANYSSTPRYLGTKSDAIIRIEDDKSSNEVKSEVIFCDVYEARVTPNPFTANVIDGLDVNIPLYIRPGMKVQAIDLDGNDLWGESNDVRVVSAPWPSLIGASTGTVNITSVLNVANIYTQSMIDNGVVIRFTDEKILNFKGGTLELEQNNKNASGVDVNALAVYTPESNIITGVNIIDGLLYFTNNIDEPKKINIAQCRKGSGYSKSTALKHHTRLIIDKEGVSVNKGHIKKSHVTLIKPSPTRAPRVEGFTSERSGITTSYLYDTAGTEFDLSPNGVLYNASDVSPDTIQLTTGNSNPDWFVGDIIRMKGATSSIEVDLVLDEKINDYTFVFEIRNIPSSYTASTAPEIWIGKLFEKENIYEDKFISFAYRYKYNDNEYSVISPYSKPLFIPGKYDYDPISGFNTGMSNNLKRVEVYDYIPYSIPKDVVEVELLYRETQSPNVYLIKKISISDEEWNSRITKSKHKGKTVINSQLFGSTIPTNQVDRLQDNVPTKAAAQEITASRLMFGNYTENYNLVDDAGLPVKARLLMQLSSKNINSELNINSTNNFEASQLTTLTNSYNVALPCDEEAIDGDTGDNYNPTNYYFEAPTAGDYTFEASCKWKAQNGILALDALNNNNYMWLFPWAYLELRDYDTQEVLATGAQYNNGDPGAHASFLQFTNQTISGSTNPRAAFNGSTWWGNTFTSNQPGWITSNYRPTLTLDSTVNLTAGKKVYIRVVAQDPTDNTNLPQGTIPDGTVEFIYQYNSGTLPLDTFSWINTTHTSEITNGVFKCTASPESNGTFNVTSGVESIKTERKYQLGVVYRDSYNRQSTVLISDNAALDIKKSYSENANAIKAKILNKAPYWADYYKFFIKENANPFYNLVMSAAYENNDASALASHLWLSFNSDDINKVQEGDFIAAKKAHGSNATSNTPSQKWKVLDISRTNPITADGETPLIADASAVAGKFFVKIAKDIYSDAFLGTSFPLDPSPYGAVFEVQPQKTIDLDIYYEVGNAYPIKLDKNNLSEFVDIDAKVKLLNVFDPGWSIGDGAQTYRQDSIDTLKSTIDDQDIRVTGLIGARSFSYYGVNSGSYFSSAVISLDKDINLNLPPGGSILIGFENKDGSVVSLSLAKSVSNNQVYCRPLTHSYGNIEADLPITLPWFNCISFGNGVESDVINDDFNANPIFPYTANGKQSGFNVNVVFDSYKEETKQSDIIFSQIYNEKSGVNRFNEFLIGENIVKTLPDENGSIQRLFTRDTDLLAFCEKKVLKVLADKDALFNADGNLQTLSTDKVLGQAIPFAGDYGISNNPESLAFDQYRIYFVDLVKRAVLRLSIDGLTVISEYGMSDWFGDNLKQAQAVIGSFDEDKGDYNLTVHQVTNPDYKKNVYTVTFSEDVKGWDSFKSFIQEQGFSLNNNYYTINKGKVYRHHDDTVSRNNFYGNQYNSSVTPIINDVASSVKSFSTINYEGTQSKVDQNTQDSSYHNLTAKNGWYVESIVTDQQEGTVSEFIEKEGKWFNNILGKQTQYTNSQEGSTASNNLDFKDFSVQGLGVPTSVSGTTAGFGHKISVTMTASGTGWESDGYTEYNIAGKANGDTSTFTITPLPGYSIAASNFTAIGADSNVNSITYSDAGVANTPSNTITVTIDWKTITLSSDLNINISDSGTYIENTFAYETKLSVYRDIAKEDVTISSVVPSIDDSASTEVNSGASIVLFNANSDGVESYKITGAATKLAPLNLYKVTLTAKPGLHYFNNGPGVQFSSNAEEANCFEVISETVERNLNDLIVSKTVIIQYTPTEDILFTDEINIGFGGGVPISSYAVFNSNQIVVAHDTNSVILPFTTNVGYLSFSATSTDNTNAAIGAVTSSTVEVALTTNSGSTGSPRTFTIGLFNSFNNTATPNDTITIIQTESSQNYVDIKTLDDADALTVTANVDLDPLSLVGSTFLIKKSLYLYTNGSAPVADTSFNSNQSWANTFIVYETDDPTVYIGRVALDINTTGSSRTATITLIHSDTSTTDTLVITQEAYDAATETALFDDADNFINVDQAGGSGTIDITTANVGAYDPYVELFDPNGDLSNYITLGDVTKIGTNDYSIYYSVIPNEETTSKVFTLKMYHPSNRTPGATANDTLTISQNALPYANFEPAQGVQSQIELSSAGETNYELNVNHNDYTPGSPSFPNTRFLVDDNNNGTYDVDITTSPGISWIPFANVNWTNSANNVDGNGILKFNVSANTTGSSRSINLGVFHSNNSSSTPNDTIIINQVSS